MAGMFSLQHSRSLWLNFNPSVRLMMQQVSWIKYHLYDPFSFHRCMTHLFPPCAWEDLRRVKLSLPGFWPSLSSLGHGLTKPLTDLSPAALLKASKRCSFIHSFIHSFNHFLFLPINLFIYLVPWHALFFWCKNAWLCILLAIGGKYIFIEIIFPFFEMEDNHGVR